MDYRLRFHLKDGHLNKATPAPGDPCDSAWVHRPQGGQGAPGLQPPSAPNALMRKRGSNYTGKASTPGRTTRWHCSRTYEFKSPVPGGGLLLARSATAA